MSSLAARELKVLSTLAVQGAMPALATGYESLAGARLEVEFAPTIGLMARIDARGAGGRCHPYPRGSAAQR
jgi:hypothetical protein